MTAKDAIKTALDSAQNILQMYVSDFTDADLLVRPVPAANHTAWQLGHVIAGEMMLIRQELPGAAYPELPAGFIEQHDKKTAAVEPPKGFGTREQYLGLFNRVREATLANLARLSDADLDRATKGPMSKFAPTLGALFVLVANHTMMHAGQFVTTRRKLGKPILM